MKHFIVGAIAAAIAFYGLIHFLPELFEFSGQTQGLIVLGLIFGVVNGMIGPVVKILSLPLSVLTMGLAGILINAGLLMLVALIAHSTGFPLSIGGFPPDVTADTLVAAVIGSTVIGVVTGVVNAIVP